MMSTNDGLQLKVSQAWRSLRLSFGWGADFEMRCLLQSLKRLGLRHGLSELPEEVGYNNPKAGGRSIYDWD